MPVQFNQFIIRFRKLESKLDFFRLQRKFATRDAEKTQEKQNYSRVKVATTVHSETC